jgi:hypothetical protein
MFVLLGIVVVLIAAGAYFSLTRPCYSGFHQHRHWRWRHHHHHHRS